MNNIIKITVESTVGAGKSSISFAIADMLQKHGIKCTIIDVEDDVPGVIEHTWRERIKSHANAGRIVEITTKQLLRNSLV